MDRRGFLSLLAGSFAAAPVLGISGLIPQGITKTRVRPVGDFPVHKIRWTQSVPMPDQAVRVSRAFLDVEHDCACGWHASGMYATVVIHEKDFMNNRDHLADLFALKKQGALLKLEDLWNTAKNEPFISHAECPKVVGAWRYEA